MPEPTMRLLNDRQARRSLAQLSYRAAESLAIVDGRCWDIIIGGFNNCSSKSYREAIFFNNTYDVYYVVGIDMATRVWVMKTTYDVYYVVGIDMATRV